MSAKDANNATKRLAPRATISAAPQHFAGRRVRAESADFLIIGGGIIGAAAAFELSRHGKTLILEREAQPGYHATGRSEALYEPLYGGRIAEGLARASVSFFTEPPARFTDHALWRSRGALYLAEHGDEAQLIALGDRARSAGLAFEAIGIDEAERRVPILRRDAIAGVLFDPATRDIEVHGLQQGFLRGLRGRGGRVLTNAEVGAVARAHGRWQVATMQGVFDAPILVNASGAWADEIARAAHVPALGHRALRRTVVVVEPPQGASVSTWPHVESIRDGCYFKPESGRLMVSPADETLVAPCDAQPDGLDVAITIDRLEKLTTLDVQRPSHTWAGLRTFTADRSPAIGFDAMAEGFFWLSGFGGYGVMTAPAAGRCCAALVCGEELPRDVLGTGVTAAMLSPHRFRTPAHDVPVSA